jgi:hypothetical protein
MAKQSDSEESDEQYNYVKLLRRREWREKRDEIIAKSPRCRKCGGRGGRLAVHHGYYDYGRLPWDYPDDAYMVVCSGHCHSEADEDREEEQRDAENRKRFGWQYELGKKLQRPREKELRKLAKYEAEFKAWIIRKEIPPQPWDWDNEMWPLRSFWNLFSDEFLAQRRSDDPQGRLAL